jgi:hypothetical protein
MEMRSDFKGWITSPVGCMVSTAAQFNKPKKKMGSASEA